MAFQQLDYFDLEDDFSEEERMVRDTVRTWVTERYLPLCLEHVARVGPAPTSTSA